MIGCRVLVIDDDPGQLDLIGMFLRQQGIDTFTSTDGEEGIQIAKRVNPDLVLLDLCLPGLDGHTTCQRLREITDAPILYFSACSDEDEIVKGFKDGAVDFIVKPIRLNELLERMKVRVRDHRLEQPFTVYQDGSLVVDFKLKRVTRNGQPVHLTPVEFKLLACLIRHRGEVVNHKTILQEVWGHCYMDAVTNLSLYVHYLREKLEDDPSNPLYIRNEWGTGYWFSEQNSV